jgi:hypothetical protein
MSGERSPAESDTAVEPSQGAAHSRTQWARWWVALAVAVGGALYFLRALGQQTVCSQSVGGAQHTEAVQLCGPPRLLDLVPFALIIGVVLWPDLSELSVSNIVTLKRRVREQQSRQEALESQVGLLQQHVSQAALLLQSQNQANTQSVVVGAPYAPAQDDLRAGIEQKEHGTADAGGAGAGEIVDGERVQLLGRFVDAYSELEPYIRLTEMTRYRDNVVNPPRGIPEIPQMNDAERRVVLDWGERYRDEIRALRQTRNVLVHMPATVSGATLRGAIENTERLRRVLDMALAIERRREDHGGEGDDHHE